MREIKASGPTNVSYLVLAVALCLLSVSLAPAPHSLIISRK